MSAMEQHNGFVGRTIGSRALAVEKRSTVLGRKVFLLFGHEKLLIVIFFEQYHDISDKCNDYPIDGRRDVLSADYG